MSDGHLFRIADRYRSQLARLRTCVGFEIAIDADAHQFWLRNEAGSPEQIKQVREKLPWAEQFVVDEHNQLVPVGKRLPIGYPPELTWRSLQSVVEVVLPIAKYAGQYPSPAACQLRRSSEPKLVNGILASLADVADFCRTALQPKFAHCRYVVNEAGQAIVLGDPLPGIRGTFLVEQDRVILPAGWSVTPAVSLTTLAARYHLGENDYLWLDADADAVRIPGECFVPLSRSSVTITQQELTDAG